MTNLGEKNSEDLAAGPPARGHRHCNDDYMREFVSKDRFIDTNFLRKHKTCHITTFEQEKENPAIFFERVFSCQTVQKVINEKYSKLYQSTYRNRPSRSYSPLKEKRNPAQTSEIVAETTASLNLPIKETFIVTNWRNRRPAVFRK